jgi:hypothetical protein
MTATSRLARAGALTLAATGLVALAPAGPASPAPAVERARVAVDISIKLSGNHKKLKGKVTSSISDCSQDVDVYLYFKKPGGGDFDVVADDYTDLEGNWSVKKPPGSDKIPKGKYYAYTFGTGYCDETKSSRLKVD